MKKCIFGFLFGMFISFGVNGQNIQIPTIHIVEFSLDSLKAEFVDTLLYLSHLQELKSQLRQENQEVEMGLDIIKSSLKNQNEQFSLVRDKIKLINKQVKTYKQRLKEYNGEIKNLNKQHKQLTNSKQMTYESKVSQTKSIESRKAYLEQNVVSTNEKINALNNDLTFYTDEVHRLDQLKLQILSSQVDLKHLKEACKFKTKQINNEIKVIKSKVK